MKTVDLFDLLTFEQREQVAEIFLEAMSNHNIFPGICILCYRIFCGS